MVHGVEEADLITDDVDEEVYMERYYMYISFCYIVIF